MERRLKIQKTGQFWIFSKKIHILKKQPTVSTFFGLEIFRSKLCLKGYHLYQYQVKRSRTDQTAIFSKITYSQKLHILKKTTDRFNFFGLKNISVETLL